MSLRSVAAQATSATYHPPTTRLQPSQQPTFDVRCPIWWDVGRPAGLPAATGQGRSHITPSGRRERQEAAFRSWWVPAQPRGLPGAPQGQAAYDRPMARPNQFLRVNIDSTQVSAASQRLADLMGKTPMLTAIAMTRGVTTARRAIQAEIFPKIQGGPSPWTRRGLIYKKATPTDLRAMVGFNYGDGRFEDNETTRQASGVASGRYMRIQARGGDRPAKSSERLARRLGIIKNDNSLIPDLKQKDINKFGNLPGRRWQEAVKGARAGFSVRGGQSTGGKRKRGAGSQFFVLNRSSTSTGKYGIGNRYTTNNQPIAIVRRTGAKMRGFKTVLLVTKREAYKRRLPVDSVAWEAFRKTYAQSFKDLVDKAWARKKNRTK